MKYRAKISIGYLLIILIVSSAILTIGLVGIIAYNDLIIFFIMLVLTIIFLIYLIIEICAYAMLCDDYLYIRYGFFKKKIKYENIYKYEKTIANRSLVGIGLSLKATNIFYDKFSFISVALKNEDEFFKNLDLKRNI